MTLLEAKSYQLPIVSFNCQTGPADLILDEQNGYLVEDGNISMMVEKVIRLLTDTALREQFSSQALANMKKFEIDEVVSRWTSLLEVI